MSDEVFFKSIFVMLAVVCLLTFTAAVASVVRADGGHHPKQCVLVNEEPVRLRDFDTSGDGLVTAADAMITLQVAVGLRPVISCDHDDD